MSHTPLSANALTVMKERYLLKNDLGVAIETPAQMFRRTAFCAALAEDSRGPEAVVAAADDYEDLVASLDFLPNSPMLANAGTGRQQLSACYVVPIEDDMAGIYDALKFQALIHQTGGGTGFSFSRLRPKNDLVRSTKGVSCGPVDFLEVFDMSTEKIKQGGVRRGANMGILRVDHPDIMRFIRLKSDLSKATNFNVSVALTGAFMRAVDVGLEYDLINPRNGEVVGSLDARKVFNEITERAWTTGEPGAFFIDEANRWCPVPWLGSYEATNPCGEQPLIPYESCNLGSINLERFVIQHAGAPIVDWSRLRQVVRRSTRMLNAVVDVNQYVPAVPKIKEVALATRKIGLGVMGFARMLFLLGVEYGSEDSLKLAGEIMSFVDYWSKIESVELAKRDGPFPAMVGREQEFMEFFNQLVDERDEAEYVHPDCDYIKLYGQVHDHGIRNSNTTTIAPTGTLSIFANTSGGCEPVYALAFKRWQAGHAMLDRDWVFAAMLESAAFNEAQAAWVMDKIDEHGGSLRDLLTSGQAVRWVGWPLASHHVQSLDALSRYFVSTHDIPPLRHVAMQAAFQQFVDSAVSKTINLPEDAKVGDVRQAYLDAWRLNCKGVTVYRNGSRKAQPLSTSATKDAATAEKPTAEQPSHGRQWHDPSAADYCPRCAE